MSDGECISDKMEGDAMTPEDALTREEIKRLRQINMDHELNFHAAQQEIARLTQHQELHDWTTDKPTKPGWYWRRDPDTFPHVVFYNGAGTIMFCSGMKDAVISPVDVEWAGPMEPPT